MQLAICRKEVRTMSATRLRALSAMFAAAVASLALVFAPTVAADPATRQIQIWHAGYRRHRRIAPAIRSAPKPAGGTSQRECPARPMPPVARLVPHLPVQARPRPQMTCLIIPAPAVVLAQAGLRSSQVGATRAVARLRGSRGCQGGRGSSPSGRPRRPRTVAMRAPARMTSRSGK